MIRNSFFALTLLLAGTGAALADTANYGAPVTSATVVEAPVAASPAETLPMHPGPYTTIYNESSDLAG